MALPTQIAISSNTDFLVGSEFAVGNNVAENDNLTDTIKRVEQKILRELLGDTLYKQFNDDLDASGDAQSPKWIDFQNGTTYTDPDDADKIIWYSGIRRMLHLFIFAEYVDKYGYLMTGSGVLRASAENAEVEVRQQVSTLIEDRYNAAIQIYCEAYKFLYDNDSEQEFNYSSYLALGPAYVFTYSSGSQYISVGQTFTVEGNEFTCTAVDFGTNEISATGDVGLTLSASGSASFEDVFTPLVHTIKEKMTGIW